MGIYLSFDQQSAEQWAKFVSGQLLTFEVLRLLRLSALDYMAIPGIDTIRRPVDPNNPPPLLTINDVGRKTTKVELRTIHYVRVNVPDAFREWLARKRPEFLEAYDAAVVNDAMLREPKASLW